MLCKATVMCKEAKYESFFAKMHAIHVLYILLRCASERWYMKYNTLE